MSLTSKQIKELRAYVADRLEKPINGAADTIELPSDRKTGKWNGTQNAECDQCGHLYPAFMRLEKYCPNCGARMEVGHE